MNISKYVTMVCAALMISACTDEVKDIIAPETHEEGENKKEEAVEMIPVTVTVTENSSRVSHGEGAENTITVAWEEGDVIYLGSPAADASDKLINAEGSGFSTLDIDVKSISEDKKTASFTGKIPSTLSGQNLLAFYGKAENLKINEGKVIMDFTQQTQSEAGYAHLADYDLMSAVITGYDGNEKINLQFKHEGAIFKVKLTQLPEGDSFSKVILSLPEGTNSFVTSKSFGADGQSTDVQTTNSIELNLGNVSGTTFDAVLTLCPTTFNSEMNISVPVTNNSGVYSYTDQINISNAILEAGKYYWTPDLLLAKDNTIKGEGTSESPYLIDNVDKFNRIADNTSAYYSITQDMDFSGATITPIETFAGTLDGGNKTLSNFTIATSNAKSGLIATNNGMVKNINISNITATKNTETTAFGIIVASNQGTISNCNISGANLTFSCNTNGTNCGTIAGENITNNAVISDVVVENSTITINSGKANAGMVVGLNGNWNAPTLKGAKVKNNNTITYNAGANNSSLGGVVGWNKGGQIIGTSSAINMYPKASSHFGGIVGSNNNNGKVIASYCYGTFSNISASTNNGGVVGDNATAMTGCYSSVSNSTPNLFGGLIGKGNGTITESYFYNCNNGKRNGQTGPDLSSSKVTDGDALKTKVESLNTAIQSSGFKYIINTSDATGNEPLILSKIE